MRGFDVTAIDNFDAFYERALKERNIAEISEQARRVKGAANASFSWVEADIRDRQRVGEIFALEKKSCVFHMAALAGVRPSIADPARYASVNIDGLVSVLEAARAGGCRDVIFASSSSVYGNRAKVPFAETDPVDQPISPYAATKRAGELICHTYSHLFDMRIAALRFFTVYGPAQRPDLAISKFMRLIAAGEEVPMFGDGATSRDYTYIDDIVEGILGAHAKVRTASQNFFRIYNLGSDHPITLAEMIDSIAHVVGKPARIRRLPMQPGDVDRTWADISSSRDELGYSPSIQFHDGLTHQWDHMRHMIPLSGLAQFT